VFAFWLLASEREVTLARAHIEEVPPFPDCVVLDEKQPS
jgi:hypothetical protein